LLIFDWSQNSLFTAKMRDFGEFNRELKNQAFLSKVNRENQTLWLGFFVRTKFVSESRFSLLFNGAAWFSLRALSNIS
jgi:hypothetical protein